MKRDKVYQALARVIAWEPGSDDWKAVKVAQLKYLAGYMPSGSGWDCGTKLDDSSTPERIVLYGEFHHMDENGFYDGWTGHEIIVTPSLAWGIKLRITGRDRNDIKDYLHEIFYHALNEELPENWQEQALEKER